MKNLTISQDHETISGHVSFDFENQTLAHKQKMIASVIRLFADYVERMEVGVTDVIWHPFSILANKEAKKSSIHQRHFLGISYKLNQEFFVDTKKEAEGKVQ